MEVCSTAPTQQKYSSSSSSSSIKSKDMKLDKGSKKIEIKT